MNPPKTETRALEFAGLRDFALGAAVVAPIVFGFFLKALAPGLPFFRWQFVHYIALGIEDVG